jgi:hypothetical protein
MNLHFKTLANYVNKGDSTKSSNRTCKEQIEVGIEQAKPALFDAKVLIQMSLIKCDWSCIKYVMYT